MAPIGVTPGVLSGSGPVRHVGMPTLRDGKVAEHWANRDDLGLGQQLGWTPPSPAYIARMLLARRRLRRAEAAARPGPAS